MDNRKGFRKKRKWSCKEVRKKHQVPHFTNLLRNTCQSGVVNIEGPWSDPKFLKSALRPPVVKLRNISRVLNGSSSILVSEFERKTSTTKGEVAAEVSVPESVQCNGDSHDLSSESEKQESHTSFSLFNMFCRIPERLVLGQFYLSSQEGNRLQLMRYNGITFEPYDWNNLCPENVKSGLEFEDCLVNDSSVKKLEDNKEILSSSVDSGIPA